MKRVYCLYRVSSKGQLYDKSNTNQKVEDDIPMQKEACHRYKEYHPDWEIKAEYLEKGVSGFKVSADERDEIQNLLSAAKNKEFDILLIYKLDRLGRIESETALNTEPITEQSNNAIYDNLNGPKIHFRDKQIISCQDLNIA